MHLCIPCKQLLISINYKSRYEESQLELLQLKQQLQQLQK
jgi:hypothetical protein